MNTAEVCLVRCQQYLPGSVRNALIKQFELLGGLRRFVCPGQTVLIKPNFIAPLPAESAAITHPVIITELARILKDFGARPFVGDSPAWGNMQSCAKISGLDKNLQKIGVGVKQLGKAEIVKLPESGLKIGISKKAIDADVIINLPKFKAHQQITATFAVKNMFGCVSGKAKALWHFRIGHDIQKFCRMLVEVYQTLAPALTIIDAVVAMDQKGPISGRARELGFIISSSDPVAIELICCELINLNPDLLPIVQAARAMNFGCFDRKMITVTGDADFQPCSNFEIPQLIPLRFTLPRIIKSISKQILLVAAAGKSKRD